MQTYELKWLNDGDRMKSHDTTGLATTTVKVTDFSLLSFSPFVIIERGEM